MVEQVNKIPQVATGPQQTVASPCVSICALDEDDICRGCYRSLTEITGWMAMDDNQRREVLARAKIREQS